MKSDDMSTTGTQDDFQEEAIIDGFTAQDLINQARYALRNVSYGSIDQWNGEDDRYANGFDFERLRVDLIRLATNGYLFYDKLINLFS